MPKTATASKGAEEDLPGLLLLLLLLGLGIWIICAFRNSRWPPPEPPKFTIIDANLTEFNYTEIHHILTYNLALSISLTNPNEKYYNKLIDIKVHAYYQDKRFGVVTLIDKWTWFQQDPKNITIFQNVVVKGQKDLLFDEPVIPAAAHDDALIYSIDVTITYIRNLFEIEIICNLKLPLISDGTYSDCYKITNCILKWKHISRDQEIYDG